MADTVVHQIAPVADENSRVLILGTMPSPKSREMGFYYGHPQNRFWPVLADVFDEEVPQSAEERRNFALRYGIALWDVLAKCSIVGASDASIKDPVPNDIADLLTRYPNIKRIYTTGKTALKFYEKLCSSQTGVHAKSLPSPSSANARMRFEELVKAYSVIKE